MSSSKPVDPAILKILAEFLSYQDGDLTAQEKERALQYTTSSAIDYAECLKAMFDDFGEVEICEIAECVKGDCEAILRRVGIEVLSGYTKSITWALWDMAKQNFYKNNPGKRDANYHADYWYNKKQEIIDRHVGWEFYRNRKTGGVLDRLQSRANSQERAEVDRLIKLPPKDNDTLASYALAELGSIIGNISKRPALAQSAVGPRAARWGSVVRAGER